MLGLIGNVVVCVCVARRQNSVMSRNRRLKSEKIRHHQMSEKTLYFIRYKLKRCDNEKIQQNTIEGCKSLHFLFLVSLF